MSATEPSAVDVSRLDPASSDRLREVGACVASALSGLAPAVTLGLLAYVALGDRAAGIGMPAAFIATVIGGSLFTLLGRGAMPVAGPASVTTLMLATLVAGIVADPAFRIAEPAHVAALLALTGAAVASMGLLQIAFAAVGLT